jgi:hypothetical protein
VSWEDAAKNAIEEAAKTLRELRAAEVVDKDLIIRSGKVEAYRTKVKLSFKYEGPPLMSSLRVAEHSSRDCCRETA